MNDKPRKATAEQMADTITALRNEQLADKHKARQLGRSLQGQRAGAMDSTRDQLERLRVRIEQRQTQIGDLEMRWSMAFKATPRDAAEVTPPPSAAQTLTRQPSQAEMVSRLDQARRRWRAFAADTTRVAGLRRLAGDFADELGVLIRWMEDES